MPDDDKTTITVNLDKADVAALERLREAKLPGVIGMANVVRHLIATHPDVTELRDAPTE